MNSEEIMKTFKNSIYMMRILYNESKLLMLFEVTMQIVRGVLPLITAYLSKIIIDSLPGSLSGKTQVGFLTLAYIVILLLLLQYIYEYLQILSTRMTLDVSHKITKHIQNELIDTMAHLDKRYFDSANTMNLIQKGEAFHSDMIIQTYQKFTGFFRTFTTIVSSFIILLNFHWFLALLSYIIYIPLQYVEFKKVKSMVTLEQEMTEEIRKRDYYAELVMKGEYAKEIRLSQSADYFIDKYDHARKNIFKKKFKLMLENNKKDILLQILKSVINVGVFAWLVFLAMKSKISIGEITFIHTAFLSVDGNLKWCASDFVSFVKNSYIVDYYKELIQLQNNIMKKGKDNLLDLNRGQHEIEFKNVTFTYPEAKKPTIKDMSFRIAPQEIVGIVGLNGAGKTTLIKLILRVYDCDEGEIIVDGKNVKEYHAVSYYDQWSALMQEYNVYQDSIQNNIALGLKASQIDTQKLAWATHATCLDGMVDVLPNKFETMVGKEFSSEGVVPSTGQAQKIAFARAFYKNSDFILLDEPSASIDALSEATIFSAIKEILQKRTGIIISHRLSNITAVDKILVIQDGELVEEGTHETLLKQNGEYARLFQLQSEKYRGKGYE